MHTYATHLYQRSIESDPGESRFLRVFQTVLYWTISSAHPSRSAYRSSGHLDASFAKERDAISRCLKSAPCSYSTTSIGVSGSWSCRSHPPTDFRQFSSTTSKINQSHIYICMSIANPRKNFLTKQPIIYAAKGQHGPPQLSNARSQVPSKPGTCRAHFPAAVLPSTPCLGMPPGSRGESSWMEAAFKQLRGKQRFLFAAIP